MLLLSRFVTKADISTYIDPKELLSEFGGNDQWKFKYDPEELQREADLVWKLDTNTADQEEVEEEEVEEMDCDSGVTDEDGQGTEKNNIPKKQVKHQVLGREWLCECISSGQVCCWSSSYPSKPLWSRG